MGSAVLLILVQACVLLQLPAMQGDGGATTLSSGATIVSVEDEVIGNILAQPIGTHTVADLNLPKPFLRRAADRIIRSSFEQRYRIVVDDINPAPVQGSSAADGVTATAPSTQPGNADIARKRATRPWTIGGGIGGLVVILAAVAARRRKMKRGLK